MYSDFSYASDGAGHTRRDLSIFYLPIRLNPRGGRQTGIPEYQVLRGLVENKVIEKVVR